MTEAVELRLLDRAGEQLLTQLISFARKGNALPSPPSMFCSFPVRRIFAVFLIVATTHGEERNVWPFAVEQIKRDGSVESGEYVGPLFFHQTRADGAKFEGFRPFHLKMTEGTRETNTLLYPFFTWQKEADYRYFTFFNLINSRQRTDRDAQTVRSLDVWPFYFSRQSGDPATDYRALFPLGGTIRNRFGRDRIRFALFPLYADVEKSGSHTTHAPWPFLNFIHGADDHGFEFWPFFGHRGRAGDYERQFYLWPLIYKSSRNLSEPEPDVKFGVLPFYTRDTKPGYINTNYFWPFLGSTHRADPAKYDETRYFWPFLVQGRGTEKYVNRWGPFYTRSIAKGIDQTWIGWPLFRHSEWEENGVAQEKNQFLFLLYWSLKQRSLANPAAPPASKTHLWPLASIWNNGAGRRQVQLLSPFEVLFPANEPIRQTYTPLFAVYRYEQRAPGDTRHSFLFSLLSWKNTPAEKEFHLGPLFSRRSTPEKSRIAIGLGLLSWRRQSKPGSWRFSLFDFQSPSASPAPTAALP